MLNENQQVAESQSKSVKNLTFIAYILYFIGIISGGIFSTIGLILAYVRRKGIENTVFHSHLSYLIRTYWIFMILQILGIILFQVRGIGVIILILNYIWYIYRLVSGFTKLSDNKAIK